MKTKVIKFRMLFHLARTISFLTLVSCASPVPEMIKTPPATVPQLREVQVNPGQYSSQKVRWGGIILETSNQARTTRVTILAKPLYEDGEPKDISGSDGRFIAIFPDFLEPHVYIKNRRITVVGRLQGSEVVQIGDYPYLHPLVQVEAHYLWPVEIERTFDDWPPWWYDPGYRPFYHPYYPYYYPYRRY